jgi:hypothetical protein
MRFAPRTLPWIVVSLVAACVEQDPAVRAAAELDQAIRKADRAMAEVAMDTAEGRQGSSDALRAAAGAVRAPSDALPAQKAAFGMVKASLLRAAVRLDTIDADQLEIAQIRRAESVARDATMASFLRTMADAGVDEAGSRDQIEARRRVSRQEQSMVEASLESDRADMEELEDALAQLQAEADAKDAQAEQLRREADAAPATAREALLRRVDETRKQAIRAHTMAAGRQIERSALQQRLMQAETTVAALAAEQQRLDDISRDLEGIQRDRQDAERLLDEMADALVERATAEARDLVQSAGEALRPLNQRISDDLEQAAGLYQQAVSLRGETGASASLQAASARLALAAINVRRSAHAAAEAACVDALLALASESDWREALAAMRADRDAASAKATEAFSAAMEALGSSSDRSMELVRERAEGVRRTLAGAARPDEAMTDGGGEMPPAEEPTSGDMPTDPSQDMPAEEPATEPGTDPAADPATEPSEPAPGLR